MNYEEVKNYIQGLPPFIPVKREDGRPLFNLETVSELAKRLDNPQDKIKSVHIVGTNGKGSTAEFLSEIMIKSGYKTGLFTSPYFEDIREQTKVNSKIIPKDKFALVFSKVIETAEQMRKEGLSAPSEFEMDVVMSFLYFAECKCDICIIEAGLGGEFDATNIINNPEICIFTPISIDHTSVLGESIESIARVKTGIIKSGCDCLTAAQDEEVCNIIKEAAKKRCAKLHMMIKAENVKASLAGICFKMQVGDKSLNLQTKLTGTYQADNAALAVSAALLLKKKGFFKINDESLKAGLLSAYRPGRFDCISRNPVIIADGAHNPAGINALLEGLKEIFPESCSLGKGFIIVAGVLADKDYDKMLEEILPHTYKAYTVTVPGIRAMKAEELAEIFINKGVEAIPEKSVRDAIKEARLEALKTGKPVVALGSLYYMGEVLKQA